MGNVSVDEVVKLVAQTCRMRRTRADQLMKFDDEDWAKLVGEALGSAYGSTRLAIIAACIDMGLYDGADNENLVGAMVEVSDINGKPLGRGRVIDEEHNGHIVVYTVMDEHAPLSGPPTMIGGEVHEPPMPTPRTWTVARRYLRRLTAEDLPRAEAG